MFSFANRLFGLASEKPDVSPEQPIILEEVAALLKYATDRGLDSDGVITKPLYESVLALQGKELTAPNEGRGVSADGEQQRAEKRDLYSKIRSNYTALSKLTAPVTGRSLVETNKNFLWTVWPLHVWAYLFLLLAVGNEILKAWFGDMPEPEEGWLLQLINLRRYALDYCTPFFWGALGSITYLLKRLSDVAEEKTFDSRMAHGWATRILLGAILGGAVQFIYDTSLFTEASKGFELKAAALGYLTGIGVKVVYGAIEKTIETLAEKMNLDSIRSAKRESNGIRQFLTEQLAKAEADQASQERIDTIKDLISTLPPATKSE